ncbi:MAG: hypothetical protein IKN34_00095, partial [Treponema sp.]|nr:hypothetical protein [Treponema sp.]
MFDKNEVALTPPMGWNSYDYYNVGVKEAEVRANALYMAENLKPFGWEYVVIDAQWSDPNALAHIPESLIHRMPWRWIVSAAPMTVSGPGHL